MTEKTLTTENIKPALDALRGELAPWPVVAKKQDRLNTAQLNAANSGITSSLVAQIIANTAAIRALESAITGTGLRALVVASLPAVGTTGILYIVPVTTYDPDTDADVVNYSNEYIWIPVEGGLASEGHYEQVGQTGIVINNGQLTITVNGTSVGTFTANQSGDTTAAITVPTNADYVDRTTDQTVAGDKTWTGKQSFTLPIAGSITGTASKAIADEDGTSIKTGYGKLAGNQTWSGENAFSNAIRQNNIRYYRNVPSLTKGTLPSSTGYYGVINDYDSTDTRFMQSRGYISTSGSNVYEWTLSAWSSNAEMSVQMFISADGTTKEFKSGANILPSLNSTYSLGSSSYQWSSVYAQSYYYNGVAWGLDKANTWTDYQYFSRNLILTRNISKGTVPSSAVNAGFKLENADATVQYVGVTGEVNANGTTFVYLVATNYFTNGALDPNGTAKSSGLQIGLRSDGTGFLYTDCGWRNNLIPHLSDSGNLNLGTSTNKWKTLNGVNPGALSLPDMNTSIAVDTTGWTYDGATFNEIKINNATQTMSGWLYIIINNAAADDVIVVRYAGGDSSNLTYAQYKSGLSYVSLVAPIMPGVKTYVASRKAFSTIKIYPMLGNV